MRSVVYVYEAEQDLYRIWHHIAADSPFRATRYVERLQLKIRLLATLTRPGHAMRGVSFHGVRVYTEKSHVILFQLTDEKLVVLRVVHGARDLRRIRLP